MSKDIWRHIAEKVDEHGFMAGVRRDHLRISATAEVFTPTELVIEILRYLDPDLLAPGKTVLDPACGDGQFLVAAKWFKVLYFGMNEEVALLDIYGVDIMRDNVDLCRRRLGGGTILMGNSLRPSERLPLQTEHEHAQMLALFGETSDMERRKRKPRLNKVGAVHRSAEDATLVATLF
jgi:SAM-dependent methyltransferase